MRFDFHVGNEDVEVHPVLPGLRFRDLLQDELGALAGGVGQRQVGRAIGVRPVVESRGPERREPLRISAVEGDDEGHLTISLAGDEA